MELLHLLLMKQIRKPNRWNKYNYSASGLYFITICTKNHYPYFGKIEEYKMHLNAAGKIVAKHLKILSSLFENGNIECAQVMPNHIHFIYNLNDDELNKFYNSEKRVSQNERSKMTISSRIGSFKRSAAKEIRNSTDFEGFQWLRSFHDHIIRDEKSYYRIKTYIKNNPKNWLDDEYNT